MKLLVVYSRAHTDPNGGAGTYTKWMTTEREVSNNAQIGVEKVISNAGGKVVMVQGNLKSKIGKANRDIRRHYRDGYKWVSIELHMNNTPMGNCSCGKRIRLGLPCPACGRMLGWQWGHKNMVLEACPQALELSTYISEELSILMPWSKARSPILSPCGRDRFVGSRVRPAIIQPAVLVEAGFASQENFQEFIDVPANQQLYGETVANAILKWYDANRGISLQRWGELFDPLTVRS